LFCLAGSNVVVIGPVKALNSSHTRIPGVLMDITAQTQAEDALRESEICFRTVTDMAPVVTGKGQEG
jgi:hypothetical protein